MQLTFQRAEVPAAREDAEAAAGFPGHLGYKLVERNHHHARKFNDASNVPYLMAHDTEHHGFREFKQPNIDEIIAIGFQSWCTPDFIEQGGGIGFFVGYQLAAYLISELDKNHENTFDSIYDVFTETHREQAIIDLVETNFEQIVAHFNVEFVKTFASAITDIPEKDITEDQYDIGIHVAYTLDIEPYRTNNARLKDIVIRMMSKGYAYGKKIYSNQTNARAAYNHIAKALEPYCTLHDAQKPEHIHLTLDVHTATVTDVTYPDKPVVYA